jgi:glycosyltransferase involved in cell wall biosynthesis
MKVLFVCSGNNKSFKISPFIKEQGESLVKQGIDVEYYPVVGKGIMGYIKAGFKLRNYLKQRQYDLIHAHYTLSGWVAVIGAKHTPVVLSLMGDDAYGEYVGVNKVKFRSRYATVLTWLIQPFVRAIISKSANIENYVYLKQKSYIIPNGVDLQKFKPLSVPADREKATNGTKKILFLGNKMNIRKNFQLVQSAVNRLNRPDVEICNPYPVLHSEIPSWLNLANVLVVPSFMEGSPNIIKEAMACNCPIVATDTGDIRWVMDNTKGCYIASFDPEDFADKLSQALHFSVITGRTAGEKRIKELGLDADTIARKLTNVYKKVLHMSETKLPVKTEAEKADAVC